MRYASLTAPYAILLVDCGVRGFNRYKYANNSPYTYKDINGKLELHVTVFPKTRVNPNNRVSVKITSPRRHKTREKAEEAVTKRAISMVSKAAGNTYSIANFISDKIDKQIAFDIRPVEGYFSKHTSSEIEDMESKLLYSAEETFYEVIGGYDRHVVNSCCFSWGRPKAINDEIHFTSIDTLNTFIDTWEAKEPEAFYENFGGSEQLELNFAIGIQEQYENDK